MPIVKTYLRSKLGARIALLFIVCALVPITLLSTVAFVQVVGHLKGQARFRLREESKEAAMSLVERLTFLERELAMLAATVVVGGDVASIMHSAPDDESAAESFVSLALYKAGNRQDLYGPPIPVPEFSAEQQEHLAGGASVAYATGTHAHGRHIHMARMLDAENASAGVFLARINPEYMWSGLGRRMVAELSQLCVIDEKGALVYSYAPVTAGFMEAVLPALRKSGEGLMDWKQYGRTHYVGYWSAYLKYRFGIPKWTVVTVQGKDSVLAPVARFQKQFPLLVILSFWAVVLLTLIEVRRRLVPLKKLSEGTQQIAQRNFKTRVNLSTGDEFEELARSFNRMAETLGRQFHTLTAITEIDRALLSALDFAEIVKRALAGLTRVFDERCVAITLVRDEKTKQARMYRTEPGLAQIREEALGELPEAQSAALINSPDGALIRTRNGLPLYLAPLRNKNLPAWLVVPVMVDNRIEGMISLGLDSEAPAGDEAAHLRQVAEQVALAMSNARLVNELQSMNRGIVRALARAVDAKSPWTLGHTERVTKIGLMIAKEMGYDERRLEDLERGTLLHDIGKIGISGNILDKPGALTDEERMLIREHPRIGRRIVEPIGVNEEILDIVSQHHERYDGQGYPLGLSGDKISLSARIIAVADVADAVGADRPYRKGMAFEDVVAIIEKDSKTAFDPQVVDAFLRLARGSSVLESMFTANAGLEKASVQQ